MVYDDVFLLFHAQFVAFLLMNVTHQIYDARCPQNDLNDTLALDITPHHAGSENKNDGQCIHLATGKDADLLFREFEANNEVNNHGKSRENESTGQPLAIEHDDEAEIDQRRARFALKNHNNCGNKNDC